MASPFSRRPGFPQRRQRPARDGFSLIEVLVVVALMGFLALYIGAATGEIGTENRFYRTAYRLEDIKEAIIGRPGLYANGVRQFTGYVSDTGNLPDLFFTDETGGRQKLTRSQGGKTEALEGREGLAEALANGYRPQPEALWERKDRLPAWAFHEDHRIWAGWRGPYLDPPADGALRDAWGNRLVFVVGEVVGRDGKTYRCRQTYAATRDNQQRPGEASAYWEVIAHGQMNCRTWQDLGTALDMDGKPVANLPEEHQTKQEIFYGDSCLTIISLGRDGRPGGEGLDKDLSITIEPAEFRGEVAGNAGDTGSGNLLARKVCLHVPDYTSDGGQIARWCIPEGKAELEDNSRFFTVQPEDGNLARTGIDFRFGTGAGYRRDCLSWECDRDGAGCTCIDYEKGDCLQAGCLNSGLGPTPAECTCTKCFMDWGVPPACAICETADCDGMPADWECTCATYATGDCLLWDCADPVDGADCECALLGDEKEDDTNTLGKDIAIGIRTLQADSTLYTVAVSPGGNWVGTVRGQ